MLLYIFKYLKMFENYEYLNIWNIWTLKNFFKIFFFCNVLREGDSLFARANIAIVSQINNHHTIS